MDHTYHYFNLKDRQSKVKEAEDLGYVMIHDHFDPEWKKGLEPHGTLTFTDEPPVSIPPKSVRDLATEIAE